MPLKETIRKFFIKTLGLVPEGPTIFSDNREIHSKELGATRETLYEVIKKSPEVVSIISALVEDVMSGFKIKGGRNKVKAAKQFIKDSNFFKKLSDALWDLFITGDAWLLKLNVTEELLKAKAIKKLNDLNIEKIGFNGYSKEILVNLAVSKVKKEVVGVKDVQVLQSKTVTPYYDENGRLNKIVQRAGAKEVEFKPEEVVHLTLINIGGEISSFTPLQPLLSDIGTLIFAKEYAGKVFENYGMSPTIWVLPESSPDSDDYKLLDEQLKQLKDKKNFFRNILVTGNVEVKQVDSWTKDMQFRELIEHFTKLMFMAWGVPPTRVLPPASGQRPTRELHENYYNKINYIQKIIESQLNSQLFSEFDVEFEFDRSYMVDELRKVNIVAAMMDRTAITVEEAREFMGFPREMPKDETLPQSLRAFRFNMFRQSRDNRIAQGNEQDLQFVNPTPNELQDNKLR